MSLYDDPLNKCGKCHAPVIELLFWRDTGRGVKPGTLCYGCGILCVDCAGTEHCVECEEAYGGILNYCQTCFERIQNENHMMPQEEPDEPYGPHCTYCAVCSRPMNCYNMDIACSDACWIEYQNHRGKYETRFMSQFPIESSI